LKKKAMIINNFKAFKGQHCETTAIGNLLLHEGIELSEPMIFGLGSGLGYIFWKMKIMDFPFIGGRIKPDEVTKNFCHRLNLSLEVHETASVKTAWKVVKKHIDNSKPVGLKLDSYYLDYFTNKIHFAGHYAALTGYDDHYAYLVDTVQQGSTVKASLENVARARNARGPMASKNLSFTISKKEKLPDLREIIPLAIVQNAKDFLNPPIKNIGYKGIEKTSKEIFKWFATSKNIENDFKLQALLMERAGTGGSLFRNIYRDFLLESFAITKNKKIESAYQLFVVTAQLWNEVSTLFHRTGETKNIEFLKQVSNILKIIADKEKKAMDILERI
jgi:hypothetical protein